MTCGAEFRSGPFSVVDDRAEERWLCLHCSEWFPADRALMVCPGCGANGLPASSRDVVQVRITWHELRCLVIWAENWAHARLEGPERNVMRRVVYGIADRLQAQHLGKKVGLTLASEIAELKAAFGPGNVETSPGVPKPPDEDDAAGGLEEWA